MPLQISALLPYARQKFLACQGLCAIGSADLAKREKAYLLRQYQHYVESFPLLLALALTHLFDDIVRFPLVQNLWEEHGSGNLEKNHRTLYEQTLHRARMADPAISGVLTLGYGPAVVNFVAACTNALKVSNPCFTVGFIGLGTEAVTAELYCILRTPLSPFGQPDDNFFDLHLQIDNEHAALFIPAITRLQETNAADSDCDLNKGFERALELEVLFWNQVVPEAIERTLAHETGAR
jgi:hypothetical protein